MHTTVTFIFFIYGLVFGSFFNVVGLRVPNGTLFAQTRSYCDTCQRTLTWKELIPVWSFLRQRGRCKKCKEKISLLYPIMELATGLLATITFYQYGWSEQTFLGLLLIALIIPITVSDIAYRKIPNKLLLFFTPLFILLRILYPQPSFWISLLGASLAFGLVFVIILLSNGGMGAGDLKYFTLLGFIFGPVLFLLLFFVATLYGAVTGMLIMKLKSGNRKMTIPFAPYIGLAALTIFYFGETILQWYLSFFS
ncbi:type 4 prepilin peptidase 1 Aspartic peptidase. MEROPS family A24A [Carnobacterium iners]|uniref:Type 4 prepilin peptidase 1 Aspartic peptidase. MEROPS family A24A n=1 Tax=Carnobacterium iners TaxID=1073423 RepID=A0A1X7NCK6_9LACT|nr:A24 family peptidase [Carnobacterium iners]SEK50852.1 type 4 prepilin peptidase 1 Aspartic peptidase. MEROPS family A24A [Carnobacterium iners]SMH34481.1 type 4 prepilin peptidase 1 Aspartic peptidase. MEROPS family A24A [Carnobacterium iners]